MMKRPANRPVCKHDRMPGNCGECYREQEEIRAKIKPLADEFWDSKGERDIEHLMIRAYHMGEQSKEEGEND